MLEKVFEIVKSEGPILPVEVGKKLGIDSFVAHAYLMQLVEAKKIKASEEKIGNAFLYFVPGKEGAAKIRASELLKQNKKTTSTFKKSDSPASPDLAEKREAFAQRLREIQEREEREKRRVDIEKIKEQMQKEDFIERFKQAITPFFIQKEGVAKTELDVEQRPEIKIEQEKEETQIAEKKEPKIKEESKVEAKPKEKKKKKAIFSSKVNAADLAIEYLTERGAEILSKNIKKKKEAEFIVKIPSGIGPIKMFVKLKDKKTINEADLSLTYTQGQSKKLPVLFLTTGKLTKTAQNYLKVIDGFLKVKFLNGEE